ncbi:hypothetical protein BJ138DRAFT_1161057 [Hygrophoropsis aurantiaca]|uniref:Uncharacterized protein n=1 Tax=Hygrophoropsis aurantiaca TaxID=72124 RepID=A0ACB8A1K4_9AGAM|nr:hypothetical protein BJ138DRAFT_1161057 [Hygrophoropsis aurantiaca]
MSLRSVEFAQQISLSMSIPSTPLSFPIEIWDECWSYVEFPDISNLALVCRLFCQLCQRRMFRSLSLTCPGHVQPTDVQRWIKEFNALTERHIALSQDPQTASLRSLVHRWKLRDLPSEGWDGHPCYSDQAFREVWQATRHSLVSSLPCYQNLRSLVAYALDIDASARTSLSQIRSLEYLKLPGCSFTSPKGPLLQLRELDLTYNSLHERVESSTAVEFVLPDRLQRLSFQDYDSTIDFIMPSLISFQSFVSLTHLSFTIEADSTTDFLVLLEKTPNLLSLCIRSHLPFQHSLLPDILNASSAPKLREIKAPIDIAALLAFERPIATLGLRAPCDSYSSFVSSLPRFFQTTAVLESLDLAITGILPCVEIFSLILETFPGLKTVRLEFHDVSDTVGLHEVQGDSTDDENENVNDPARSTDSVAHLTEEEPLRRRRQRKVHRPKYFCVNPSADMTKFSGCTIFGVHDTIPIQVGEDGLPCQASNTFTGLMDWVALGHARLPPNVEDLSLTQRLTPEVILPRLLTRQQQRSILFHLSRNYPRLKSITLGAWSQPWKRVGGDFWEEPS